MCFGDSTTQAQWPPILEEELNRRGGNIRFKVIDRGRVFNRISRVLYFLEGDLDKYQPDMVVVMMGMLEGRWGTKETGWGGWLADRFDSFWAGVRLLVGRWGEGERRNGERKLIKVFEWLERRPKEEAPPKEAASLKADDYIRWGKRYRGEGRFDKAEKMFKQGIAASPGDASGYVLLGRLYQAKDDDEKAEELYRAGIRAVNQKAKAYFQLGNLYRDRGEYDRAKRMYVAGMKEAPRDLLGGYIELAELHRMNGEIEEAKKIYEKMIKTFPENPYAYDSLGTLYLECQEYEKAEEVFNRGYLLTPEFEQGLSMIYFLQGKTELAKKYGGANYRLPPNSLRGYRKLRDVVLGRGIKLVCMQYPRCPVADLEKVFGKKAGIRYVENVANFEKALETHEVKEIFRDLFFGNFGHCTDLGNRLIAENLADAILRGVFGDRDSVGRGAMLN